MFDFNTLESAKNYIEVRRFRNYRIVYNPVTKNGYLDYIGLEYRGLKWFSVSNYKIEWKDFFYSPAYANKELRKFVKVLEKYNL